MKRIVNIAVLVLVTMVFALSGCGKQSGVKGKVVDRKGKPLVGVKLIAKQIEPINGYEHFETQTGSDGTFLFKKLFPTSEYEIIPWFDDWSNSPWRTLVYEADDIRARFKQDGWTTRRKMVVRSGPEGKTIMLKTPIKIFQTITTVAGKVADGQGKPMAGVKLVAKQVEPINGYEQFATTTGSDGTFRFKKLFPTSQYMIFPWSNKWTANVKIKIQSGFEGETSMLRSPLAVRFTSANDVVTDTKTGLMWAAHDNGKDIDRPNASAYCKNYKGGGFSDWRLPSQDELVELYKAEIQDTQNQIISRSACCPWASETRGSEAATFNFSNGTRNWYYQSVANYGRALPVRSGK